MKLAKFNSLVLKHFATLGKTNNSEKERNLSTFYNGTVESFAVV